MSKLSASVPFDDGKAPDAMRTIGEVAAGFDIKQHILRYWEQQFPMLRPLKRSGGRRLYRPEDVSLVGQINQLINQDGYTLKGARQVIEGGGKPAVVAQTSKSLDVSSKPLPDMLPKLKAIRQRLSDALESA